MAIVSVTYVLLLPAFLIGALVYNLVVYTKAHKNWGANFMCQHCGAFTKIQPGHVTL